MCYTDYLWRGHVLVYWPRFGTQPTERTSSEGDTHRAESLTELRPRSDSRLTHAYSQLTRSAGRI
jgi:hypothetical protein